MCNRKLAKQCREDDENDGNDNDDDDDDYDYGDAIMTINVQIIMKCMDGHNLTEFYLSFFLASSFLLTIVTLLVPQID